MKRRVVLQGKEANTKFLRSQRVGRKAKRVLASSFEAYQCSGADVCSEI